MALVVFPSTWTAQPGAARAIGGSSPYGQRVIFSAYNTQTDWRHSLGNFPPGAGSGSVVAPVAMTPSIRGIVPAFDGGTTSLATVNSLPALPQTITISWWMYKASFITSKQSVAFAFHGGSGVTAENSNGFVFLPDDPSGLMLTVVGGSAGGFADGKYPKPSAGAWHHYLWGINKNGISGIANAYFYVDAVLQTNTGLTSGSFTTPWGNNSLDFGGATGFSTISAECRIANFIIFDCLLPGDIASKHLYLNSFQILARPRRFRGLQVVGGSSPSRWFLTQ